MDRHTFDKLDIKEKVAFVNSKTEKGIRVDVVAAEIGIGYRTLRDQLRYANYKFDKKSKGYISDERKEDNEATIRDKNKGNNIEIAKGELKHDQEEIMNNKANIKLIYDIVEITKEEIKVVKELLLAKEQLFERVINFENNDAIKIVDIDRSSRKKTTFNIDIRLLEELENYGYTHNISKSDIANIAIKEYLEKSN